MEVISHSLCLRLCTISCIRVHLCTGHTQDQAIKPHLPAPVLLDIAHLPAVLECFGTSSLLQLIVSLLALSPHQLSRVAPSYGYYKNPQEVA